MACAIRWCKTGAEGTVRVIHSHGDGSWRVYICQTCADTIGIAYGHELPSAETIKRRITGEG